MKSFEKYQRKIIAVAGILLFILTAFILSRYLFLEISHKKGLPKQIICPTTGDKNAKVTCWRDNLEDALNHEGLEEAFALFSRLFQSEPEFAGDCHGFVHLLGEKAYVLFSQGRKISFTDKMGYCGYGFYHGFVDSLLQKKGTLQTAREFCKEIKKTSEVTGLASWVACYHGFGHGILDGSDTRTWGDDLTFIKPGLSLCEKVGGTNSEKDFCASGVFNSLANKYSDLKYGFNFDPTNPYRICSRVEKDYFGKPCYEEMNTVVFPTAGNNILKSAQLISSINEEKYAKLAMQSTAGYAASFNEYKSDLYKSVVECHSIQDYLKVSCIIGFVGGFMEKGTPGKEYVQVLDYCSSKLLSENERDACYQRFLNASYMRYERGFHQRLCDKVAREYKDLCPKA